jgi:hypothetical protein
VEDVVAALELVAERIQALREEQRRRDEVAARVIVLHWPRGARPGDCALWGGLARSVDEYLESAWWPTADDFSRIQSATVTKLIPVAMDWPTKDWSVLRFGEGKFEPQGVDDLAECLPRPGKYVVADLRGYVHACRTLKDAVVCADLALLDLPDRAGSRLHRDQSLCVVVRKTEEGAYEEAHRTAYDGELFAYAYENGARVFCAHPNEGWTRCDADDAAAYVVSCAPSFAEMFL